MNLTSLMNDTRAAFDTRATVTFGPQRTSVENGEYGVAFVRPNDALSSILLATREILVVMIPYPAVQIRDIGRIRKLQEQHKERLEPGMAIVIHVDPVGNERLREWGREWGVTILPLEAAPRLPKGELLDAGLCVGLYQHDPFDLAGPVRAAHQFFGRGNVSDLARRLRAGTVLALFGIRKIGKTSVLNRVLDEASTHHGMATVMIDCSDDNVSQMSAASLLDSISKAVAESLAVPATSPYATLQSSSVAMTPGEAASQLLTVLESSDRPVLLVFDELDYITPSSPVAPHWRHDFNPFFRSLRRVYQESARRGVVFSLMFCGVSSRWFSEESVAGVENAALAFVPETYLPPFERAESQEMLVTLGRACGLNLSDSACDVMASTCSDIPSWLRRLGSYVNSCYAISGRPTRLRDKDVTPLCAEFVEVEGAQLAYSSLRHLFRIYPDLAEVALHAIGHSDGQRPMQRLISTLGRYGLLGATLTLSGPMVEAGMQIWLEEEQQRESELPLGLSEDSSRNGTSQIKAGSASAAGEEEWADLLSEVSRLRNILERDLREFATAVVRTELAARNDQRKVQDVLLSALPFERREQLKGLSVRALVREFYWLDLGNLIRKNWPMFESRFSDRKKFDLYMDIINDRPDAHAKEVDVADLALQRRAIGWMRSCVDTAGML